MEKKFKNLSKVRSLTIPKDIAAHLGLSAGAAVDLIAGEDGSLIIRRHVDTCRFCGGVENVKQYRDISVCKRCADDLRKEVCS